MPGRRYRLDERLAAGGSGEIWQATDVILDRQVAVKLLRDGPANDTGKLARFRAEARHAGVLSHENVARIYDYDEPPAPDPPFMVMELVSGPSAAAVLAGGPMDPARVMDIIAQAAAGLAAAHRAGLVHRDITPGSLLLAPGDVVKITNFGLSQVTRTAGDLEPGQKRGVQPGPGAEAQPGPGADLYSLGLVAQACLGGLTARADTPGPAAGTAERDRPLPSWPESVPDEVAALVAELSAADPAARPGSAAEVARRAGELRDRMKPSAPAPEPVMPGGAEATDDQGPAPAPSRPAGGHLGRRVALSAGTAVAVVVTLILASVTGPASPGRAARVPTSTAAPSALGHPASTVQIDTRSLIGQPVRAVARRLHRLGLEVRLRWQRSDQQPWGTVLAVRSRGRLAPGSLITLTGALGFQDRPRSRHGAASARRARPHRHAQRASRGPADHRAAAGAG
jgi:eukaryotic-like serine/threonine-protein kinase